MLDKPFIINPDDFLNTLKPKPIKERTDQEIFDKVVRQIVRQKIPCVKMDDVTGEVSLVNFNSSGFQSPLFMFFTREDMRYLQKTIGYDFLQTEDFEESISTLEVFNFDFQVARQENPESFPLRLEEPTRKIWELLNTRGISSHRNVRLLCRLERNHTRWYGDLSGEKYRSQTSYGIEGDKSPLWSIHDRLYDTADSFSVSRGVLDWDRP